MGSDPICNICNSGSEGEFANEGCQVEVVQHRELHVDGIVQQVLPEVVPEEVPPLAHDIVEQEEAVHLAKKQDLVGGQRIDLVIRPQKEPEARLEQRVRAVGEGAAIAGARRHPRQEVEVEQP